VFLKRKILPGTLAGMKRVLVSVVAMAALVAPASACGGDDDEAGMTASARPPTAPTPAPARRAAAPVGPLVRILPSAYGPILFDGRGQVVYGFTRDRLNLSRCYGECARAWPPFIARARPRAGRNVNPRLLGTTRRRDGKLQVTYAGKPLYFYVNEGRRQVRCHNVFLNGGLWLVVRPSGRYVR
jgi:predicted lipoprotein with Yx(FWY)xxD motif